VLERKEKLFWLLFWHRKRHFSPMPLRGMRRTALAAYHTHRNNRAVQCIALGEDIITDESLFCLCLCHCLYLHLALSELDLAGRGADEKILIDHKLHERGAARGEGNILAAAAQP
jgi:hypothetical protein